MWLLYLIFVVISLVLCIWCVFEATRSNKTISRWDQQDLRCAIIAQFFNEIASKRACMLESHLQNDSTGRPLCITCKFFDEDGVGQTPLHWSSFVYRKKLPEKPHFICWQLLIATSFNEFSRVMHLVISWHITTKNLSRKRLLIAKNCALWNESNFTSS